MNYWITTHWPPREDSSSDSSTGIWLPDGRESPGIKIARDDLVLIYESRSGRTLLRQMPDGTTARVRCKLGHEGIICLGSVRGPLATDANSIPESYVDGTTIWWRWHAPIEVVSRSGYVPRSELALILGYKSSYRFRGFGERHSGLRKISEAEYAEIIRRFHEARPINLRIRPIPRSARKGIQAEGGESDTHRELKEFVAANPSSAIGEVGLRTLHIEYPFVTGDRADIVLADVYERIVAVEIESEVTDIDDAGPLQAIKYRFMLEWTTNRAPKDSRAFLIAHKIEEKVRKQCAVYGIECYEIPRREVSKWREIVTRKGE